MKNSNIIIIFVLLGLVMIVSSCTQQPQGNCGNNICETDLGETSARCPGDCPKPVLPVCGNNICETDRGEISASCPKDCPKPVVCGDRVCQIQAGENSQNCVQDCPTKSKCGDQICDAKEIANPNACPSDCVNVCGNQICETSESCSSCSEDCGVCVSCGDGTCSSTETCSTCASDCGACPEEPSCGDGTCNGNETVSSCPEDCPAEPYCGDGTCDENETYSTCPQDCPAEPFCGDGDCNGDETCSTCSQDCGACPSIGEPIYIFYYNHYKDHVNVNDDIKIINDLLDLFEENNMDVEWSMNGVMLQAIRDGVKWPAGHGHSTDEWLIEPNPQLIQRLQNARSQGSIFSSFSDAFMPHWGISKIQSSELGSFNEALKLELKWNTYYRDPVSGVIDTSRTGGQFKIFEEIFGAGSAYSFNPTLEPHYEYAARTQGGAHFGSDTWTFAETASQYEGPWYWYMGDLHVTPYAEDLLDAAIHFDPTAGTQQIDEDITAMKAWVEGSNAKYATMYAGAHTYALYMQGCMNAGEWDYDNPPDEPCIRSPYGPDECALTSYSIGSMGGNLIDPGYDESCYMYLNSEDRVPTDWYEMMHNPATQPMPLVVSEGRREEIYQRNLDYLSRLTRMIKEKADSDPDVYLVTRETARDLVQDEEGRQINKDTIYQIALYLINSWSGNRPPNFVVLESSSSAPDGGSDYFTISESYQLLHQSLAYYSEHSELPASLTNSFALAPTGLDRSDDIMTLITAIFSINDIIDSAVLIDSINEYGDYQISDSIIVSGREMNPAEFLLLMANAYKELYEGSPDEQINFAGSKIITPLGASTSLMPCTSGWCPYQAWTYKPAKFIG